MKYCYDVFTGSSEESYILHMVHDAMDLGYRWVNTRCLCRGGGWGGREGEVLGRYEGE